MTDSTPSPLARLIAQWRSRARTDLKYGTEQSLESDREYYGTVNAGFEAAQCADELEAALLDSESAPQGTKENEDLTRVDGQCDSTVTLPHQPTAMESTAMSDTHAGAPKGEDCQNCGCTSALCLEYRLHGQVCCPECSHSKVRVAAHAGAPAVDLDKIVALLKSVAATCEDVKASGEHEWRKCRHCLALQELDYKDNRKRLSNLLAELERLRVSSRSPEPQHDVLPHKYNDRHSCEACHLFWCMSRNQADGVFEPCECNCDLVPIADTVSSRSPEPEKEKEEDLARTHIHDDSGTASAVRVPLDAVEDLEVAAWRLWNAKHGANPTANLLATLDELYPLPDDEKRAERAGRTAAILKWWMHEESAAIARQALSCCAASRSLETETQTPEVIERLARSFAMEYLTAHFRGLREGEQKRYDQLVVVMLAFASQVTRLASRASAPPSELETDTPRLTDIQRICGLNAVQAMRVQEYIQRLASRASASTETAEQVQRMRRRVFNYVNEDHDDDNSYAVDIMEDFLKMFGVTRPRTEADLSSPSPADKEQK